MNGRRSEETLYTAVLLAFLAGLVALGLLGVPAPLVAAIGALVAALAIVLFRGPLEARRGGSPTRRARRQKVPERYVPSVLEGSSMKRRRGVHLGKRRHSAPPLRFR
jgi:hypothetical protein